MERDPAAVQQVRWWTGGYVSHPTVQIGGDSLVEPRLDELELPLAPLCGLTAPTVARQRRGCSVSAGLLARADQSVRQ